MSTDPNIDQDPLPHALITSSDFPFPEEGPISIHGIVALLLIIYTILAFASGPIRKRSKRVDNALTRYSLDRIVPANPDTISGRAPRPRDVSLNNAEARRALTVPMCTLEDGLALALRARQEDRNERSQDQA